MHDGLEYNSDASELPLEKFFEQRIEESTIDMILQKQRSNNIRQSTKRPAYDRFEHCKVKMQEGIEVIKHNYSNKD